MNYISTVQIAKKWGISATRVTILAKDGRIPGVVQIGSRWMIPENAVKPADNRTKSAQKTKGNDVFFRFPVYVNGNESSYNPPLSEAEQILMKTQKAFYACRFNEAAQLVSTLLNENTNRYLRISALFLCCYLSVYSNENKDFDTVYCAMNTELAKDFPYKKDMQLLRFAFDSDLGYYRSTLDEFAFDPEYEYHPSSFYYLMITSFLPIENGDFSLLSKLRFESFEFLCQKMEQEGCYFEAQQLHYLLLVIYQLQENEEKMLYHTRCGLKLAKEYELYFYAAYYKNFYPEVTRAVLMDFPDEFSDKICSLEKELHECFSSFFSTRKNPSFLSILSVDDFELAFLASQGYTNKQISCTLNMTEKEVSQKYSVIYEKLGIKNKHELVKLLYNTHKRGSIE